MDDEKENLQKLMLNQLGEMKYVPFPNEPSIFTAKEDKGSDVWLSWFACHVVHGPKRSEQEYPLRNEVSSSESMLFMRGAALRFITELIARKAYDLPDKPPPLRTRDKRFVSNRWIIDICIRDDMTPQEALQLAYALTNPASKPRWG